MFRIASKEALKSSFGQHRLGAVIVKGSRVLSAGYNELRYTKELKKWNVHAEEAAILKLLKAKRLSSLAGADLYVTRFTRGGAVGCSKPCANCQVIIKAVGIRNVHYINKAGYFETYRPTDN